MPDREKVINGLDCCLDVIRSRQFSSGCGFCPYVDTERCKVKMVEDAIALLKEQEPIKPQITGHGEFETEGSCWYECGDCGTPIDPDDKYCRKCGKAVKWE